MNLPIGKKSLAGIELRSDPIRRIVELTTLLEWLLIVNPESSISSPKEAQALTLFIESKGRYLNNVKKTLEACQVRNRLVHLTPATKLPTLREIESANSHLREEISGQIERSGSDVAALVKANSLTDPRNHPSPSQENTTPSLDEIDALRRRVSTLLRQLDICEGRRVSLTGEKDELVDLTPRVERHHLRLGSDSFQSVCNALEETEGNTLNLDVTVSILKRVVNSLQESLNDLLSFESEWRLSPGVIPLNAIRLEPDISIRIRLLTTLIEHQLAWILPQLSLKKQTELLQAGPGVLFKDLVAMHESLLPDEQMLLKALDVRNQLVRVIPHRPTLSMKEIEEAEQTLWQTAYELRRHCYFEHAKALSRQPYPGARTKPLNQIRKIENPKLRLFSLDERLETLMQTWEERNPGLWLALEDGKMKPSLLESLKRHQSFRTKINASDLRAALELPERVKAEPAGADEISVSSDGRKSQQLLERTVELLEKELDLERVSTSAQSSVTKLSGFLKPLLSSAIGNRQRENLPDRSLVFLTKEPEYRIILIAGSAFLLLISIIIYIAVSSRPQVNNVALWESLQNAPTSCVLS